MSTKLPWFVKLWIIWRMRRQVSAAADSIAEIELSQWQERLEHALQRKINELESKLNT